MVYQLKKWHYHSFIPQIKVWWQHRHTYNLAGTNLTRTENVHSTTDFEFTVQGQSYLFRLLRYTEAQLSCIFSTIITCVNQMQNNIGIPTLTAIPLQLLMWHTLILYGLELHLLINNIYFPTSEEHLLPMNIYHVWFCGYTN